MRRPGNLIPPTPCGKPESLNPGPFTASTLESPGAEREPME